MDGPPWTLCDAQSLPDGRIRLLIRRRGGRLIRVTVAAVAGNGFDIDALVDRVVGSWPNLPSRDY